MRILMCLILLCLYSIFDHNFVFALDESAELNDIALKFEADLVSESLHKDVVLKTNEIAKIIKKESFEVREHCKRGEYHACPKLEIYEGFTLDESIRDILLAGCTKGYLSNCYELGAKFYINENNRQKIYDQKRLLELINLFKTKRDYKSILGNISDISTKQMILIAQGCSKKDPVECLLYGYLSPRFIIDNSFKNSQSAQGAFNEIFRESLNYFKDLCENKKLFCNHYVNHQNLTLNYKYDDKYIKFHQNMCDKDVASSCYRLGLERDKSNDTKSDSVNLFIKSCYLGNIFSCEHVSNLEISKGNEVDAKKFAIYSCQRAGRTVVCIELAKTIENTDNKSEKMELMRYGCLYRGDETICESLVSYFTSIGNWETAKKISGLMCNDGSSVMCRHLAFIYFYQKKFDFASEVLNGSCLKTADINSCMEHGNLLAFQGRQMESETLYKELCSDSPSACNTLTLIQNKKRPKSINQVFYKSLLKGGDYSYDDSWEKQ